VKVGDQEWSFDEDEITLDDAFVIKSVCGMGIASFLRGVADYDPDALKALLFWLRKPAEPALRPDHIKLRLMDFDLSQDDEPEVQDPPG
jgi:hypothetical protein